ncbi:MAG TPA: hypothetical protein VGR88_07850, partial [Ktedonobacterales bacterium]|nr:hypothetical protein [Ktedonobacterales bacterium]
MSGFSTDEQQRSGVAIHFLGASASEVPDMVSPPCVLSGSSNVELAQTVAMRLGSSLLDRRIE